MLILGFTAQLQLCLRSHRYQKQMSSLCFECKKEDIVTRLIQNSNLFSYHCIKVKHTTLFRADESGFFSFLIPPVVT